MLRPCVTVYITSHNYGRFLRQAIDSVLHQTLEAWELFIVDDGSDDGTATIAAEAAAQDPRITAIVHATSLGLRASANEVLAMARGEYVIRLDADDYFDENALLVLASYLDLHPDTALVYPNWIYIGEDGAFLGIESRKKVGREARLLDLPAHGACTMVRKRVLKAIGGYDPQFDAQDGHELWLKVLHRFEIGNVTTPLFYYRQHGTSMSRDEKRLEIARQKIKRGILSRQQGAIKPRVVAVIPAKNTYEQMPNVALEPVAGRPLIDYTLDAAYESGVFDHVYVFADDPRVIAHCEHYGGVLADLRPAHLSSSGKRLAEVLRAAVEQLEAGHEIFPDIVVLLSVHTPLRTANHIQEAVDTLRLHNVDNVISTYADIELHFRHGQQGMEPLNPGMLSRLRFEREALFVDNGAVHAMWRDFVGTEDLYRGRIGHIVMSREESMQVKSLADTAMIAAWLAEAHGTLANAIPPGHSPECPVL